MVSRCTRVRGFQSESRLRIQPGRFSSVPYYFVCPRVHALRNLYFRNYTFISRLTDPALWFTRYCPRTFNITNITRQLPAPRWRVSVEFNRTRNRIPIKEGSFRSGFHVRLSKHISPDRNPAKFRVRPLVKRGFGYGPRTRNIVLVKMFVRCYTTYAR